MKCLHIKLHLYISTGNVYISAGNVYISTGNLYISTGNVSNQYCKQFTMLHSRQTVKLRFNGLKETVRFSPLYPRFLDTGYVAGESKKSIRTNRRSFITKFYCVNTANHFKSTVIINLQNVLYNFIYIRFPLRQV